MEKHVVFLDTNIFEAENFFAGRNLNHLAELSKSGQIEVKITDVIQGEIIQRIKENVAKSNSAFKKAHALITGEGKIYKNIEKFNLPKIDVDELNSKLIKKLDEFITENQFEVIETSAVDSKKIFADYFNLSPPFREGKKKSEFPDAFSFSAIKEWAASRDIKVFFISDDPDFNGLNCDEVDCSHNLSTIIDLLAREIDERHTKLIEEIYDDAKYEIINSLETEFLDDLSEAVYVKYNRDPFYEDVEVTDIHDIEVEIDIGVINEIVLNESFSYEIESNISFSIRLEFTDLESGYYHKEAGLWLGEERVGQIKQFTANVISIAEFRYDYSNNSGFYYRMTEFTIRDVEEL